MSDPEPRPPPTRHEANRVARSLAYMRAPLFGREDHHRTVRRAAGFVRRAMAEIEAVRAEVRKAEARVEALEAEVRRLLSGREPPAEVPHWLPDADAAAAGEDVRP